MQKSKDEKIKEEIDRLVQQGLVCLKVFGETGNRLQFTAFQDQVDAFAEEAFDEDFSDMVR